jgi:hypothetical protein
LGFDKNINLRRLNLYHFSGAGDGADSFDFARFIGRPSRGGQIGHYRLNYLKRARADILARFDLCFRVRKIRFGKRDGDRLKNARPEIRASANE